MNQLDRIQGVNHNFYFHGRQKRSNDIGFLSCGAPSARPVMPKTCDRDRGTPPLAKVEYRVLYLLSNYACFWLVCGTAVVVVHLLPGIYFRRSFPPIGIFSWKRQNLVRLCQTGILISWRSHHCSRNFSFCSHLSRNAPDEQTVVVRATSPTMRVDSRRLCRWSSSRLTFFVIVIDDARSSHGGAAHHHASLN